MSASSRTEAGASAIPRHVAIVMDGNGRWAKKRFLPRFFGHKAGVDALVKVIDDLDARGVEYLTVFAFSSENWKRPSDEVSGLMGLVLVAMSKYLERMARKGVRVRIVGDREAVSDPLKQVWAKAEAETAANTGITVTVAFNYGGRWDVVQACRAAMKDGLAPEAVTEATLAPYMAMAFAPDPDLLIRTGGEFRISNFLLWQIAYAELYFSECLWPDFGPAEIDRAFASYAQRERRFGGVPSAAPAAEAR